MSSQPGFGRSRMFQSINEDLKASLATADELSREFNSMLSEVSPRMGPVSQTSSGGHRQTPPPSGYSSSPSSTSFSTPSSTFGDLAFSTSSIATTSGRPYSPGPSSMRPVESILSGSKNRPSTPQPQPQHHQPPPQPQHHQPPPQPQHHQPPPQPQHHQPPPQPQHHQPPQVRLDRSVPTPDSRSDGGGYSYASLASPNQSPGLARRSASPGYHGARGSPSYKETGAAPLGPVCFADQSARASSGLLSLYDAGHMSRELRERSSSPLAFTQSGSSTLPRNFMHFRTPDEGMQRKIPSKWNETDLDMSVERNPSGIYDKAEWMRASVPNSSWRESNLDGPPPLSSSKKDGLPRSQPPSYSSLSRVSRVSVPPERASPTHQPFSSQPVGRISIPPSVTPVRRRQPIPLSVIMRLQNPHWNPQGDVYRQSVPVPGPRYQAKPLDQTSVIYSEVLHQGDIDPELERLESLQSASTEPPSTPLGGEKVPLEAPLPRPLSPTRLQPIMAPEAQTQEIANLEELLQIRADIPRALKRRGSVDQSRSLPVKDKMSAVGTPNQYRHLINKLFRRGKAQGAKSEQGPESGNSSSDGEEGVATTPPTTTVPSPLATPAPHDQRNYNSILRRASQKHKDSGRRARLSPLVLLLDGSLVGELETVQKAVQEMNDPSQPNDEGITAVHNAICGGHYAVVDFLVRIGANVSSPDSHGWTPLHCAASCNDLPLCEFLVRSGAAVMAVTESDEATASQKCDPYAEGFHECESFLRGVEEAMGVENGGVLYALWSYPAQAQDELSFKEGDMVTILQKQEGVNWWWASLCGREGFVPNNYFGLFPKVRPKSLC